MPKGSVTTIVPGASRAVPPGSLVAAALPNAGLPCRRPVTGEPRTARRGMGPWQGRICGAIADTRFGWKQTSVWPPMAPVPVSALSSRDFQFTAFKENS